jgi:hypothetical protein
MTVDDVMQVIDRATGPKIMSKEDALDFLERIETELQGRMEALRDEIDEP